MTADKKHSSVQKDNKRSRSSSNTRENKSKNGNQRKSDRKEAKTKSKMSDRSKSSQQKSVTRGLSPPKSRSSHHKSLKRGVSPPKTKQSSLQSLPTEPSDHEMDKTQWEFSRYKDEAVGIVDEDPNLYVVDKVGEGTPFLAEQKQKMMIRGEHLLQKPIYTLFFLFVEIILGLTVMIAWSFFVGENGPIPVILCYANIIIILIVLLIVFVIQFGRFNVVKEDLDEDCRFRIPYEWKYWICLLHMLRFFLICANITVGALDNDFDGGTIIMIATMPVMLILSAGHVFFALRPQG